MSNGSTGTGLHGWYPLAFDSNGIPTIDDYKTWAVSTATGTTEEHSGLFADEDSSWKIEYNGTWTNGTWIESRYNDQGSQDANASGGNISYGCSQGDTAVFEFTGSQVTWYTKKGPYSGIAQIFIDDMNNPVNEISLYSTNTEYNVIGHEAFHLHNGSHNIMIKRKSSSPSGSCIYIDKFEYR
jgi:hypothetical protein